MSTPVLLLTATVTPGQTVNTARADPQARLADYRTALSAWLRHGPCNRIVMCESSAAPADWFAEQAALAKQLGRIFEYYSFQQDFPPPLGKGFGELGVIGHALEHSRLLAEAPIMLKATGRYLVRNAAVLTRQAASGEADVICDLREHLTDADCRWFAGTPVFFQRYLLPRREACDDSRLVFLEHVLAKAVHAAMADGLVWRLPRRAPIIEGLAGTTSRPLRTSLAKRLRLQIKRRMLAF